MSALVPPWLSEAVVVEANERLQRLVGAWRATPVGAVLELDWPPEAPPRVVGTRR